MLRFLHSQIKYQNVKNDILAQQQLLKDVWFKKTLIHKLLRLYLFKTLLKLGRCRFA